MNNEREALQKIVDFYEKNKSSIFYPGSLLAYDVMKIAKDALVVCDLISEDRSMRYLLPRGDQ